MPGKLPRQSLTPLPQGSSRRKQHDPLSPLLIGDRQHLCLRIDGRRCGPHRRQVDVHAAADDDIVKTTQDAQPTVLPHASVAGEDSPVAQHLRGGLRVPQVAVEQHGARDRNPRLPQLNPHPWQRSAVPDHTPAGLRHPIALPDRDPAVQRPRPQLRAEGRSPKQHEVEGPQPVRHDGITQRTMQLGGHEADGIAVAGGPEPAEVRARNGGWPAAVDGADQNHQAGDVAGGKG